MNPQERLRRSGFVLCIIWGLVGTAFGGLLSFQAEPKKVTSAQSDTPAANLDYFYIVSNVRSDVAPLQTTYILDIQPAAGGITIRNIRIAPPDLPCGSVTIKAVETRLNGVTPAELAPQINPCSLTLLEVLLSMKEPKTQRMLGDSTSFGIVASCGGETEVFYLPSRGAIDFEGLQKQAPHVAALWDLSLLVQKAAFGEKSLFSWLPEDRNAELQRFGDSLAPDLLAGKYDMGFPQFCGRELHKWKSCDPNPTLTLLHEYRPGLKVPELTAKLENAERYHFIKYVAPAYPELAKRARLEFSVNLELTIDPETGKTTKALVLSGHPLLNESAVNAALQWQFDLSLQKPKNSLKLVLIYSLVCPQLPLAGN
jgi:TonB family protein